MKRITCVGAILSVWLLFCSSCTYHIGLAGITFPAEMKTISVSYFDNNAPLVINYLSQQFTEALKDRVRTTTSLSIVRDETVANASMSGSITGYNYAPASIQATNNNVAPIAGATRLTITVNVVYTNKLDKTLNFTQAFSAFKDFTGDPASQEQNLITAINKQLTEDIFNKAFNNW